MNTELSQLVQGESMCFEWNHSRDDCLAVLEYQFLHTGLSAFGVAARRRARLIIFMIFLAPLSLLYFVNINQQSLVPTLIALGFIAYIFWMLVLKKPNLDAIQASTRKLAKRYVDGASTIPTGTHRLSTNGQVLEWHWIDGDERSSYPISKIEDLCESDARIYFIRKGEVADSIPFHAFGDQETRRAFVQMIEDSRSEIENV